MSASRIRRRRRRRSPGRHPPRLEEGAIRRRCPRQDLEDAGELGFYGHSRMPDLGPNFAALRALAHCG